MWSSVAWFRSIEPVLNLISQAPCPLCQRAASQGFCCDCTRQIQRCRMARQVTTDLGPGRLFVWGSYGGALKRAIAALKYEQHPQLAQPLGHWMGQRWLEQVPHPPPLVVIPIPMYAEKQRQRGFNQAELLAQAFCQVTRLPLERQGLQRLRSTDAQFGLSAAQRQQNLAGAMQVHPRSLTRLRQRPVLLLDDIYTTGATVRAAIQALEQQKISVYGAAALAMPSSM